MSDKTVDVSAIALALAAPFVEYRRASRFPGYRVSNTGVVQSELNTRRRPTGSWRTLNPALRHGYPCVNLGGRGVAVHRLVLETFVGPCPPGLECLHRDGDRANNHIANLRWGTRVENIADTARHGRIPSGDQHWNAQLDPDKVAKILAALDAGGGVCATARRFGLTHQLVSQIRTGKRWKQVAREWRSANQETIRD